VGVYFRSVREQFDTSTAMGRLLLNLLASLAEFELEMIWERVVAGMERARRQGKPIGLKKVSEHYPDWEKRLKSILERVSSGEISKREAARILGVGVARLYRYAGWTVMSDKV